MTFCEAFDSMHQDAMDCDNTLRKLNIFTEASAKQYGIDLKKCELKVLTEAGTDEDLAELKGAATDGLVGKLSKAIKKIYETVKEFLEKISDKIKETFMSKEAEAKLDEIEEKIKANPKLKDEKIKIPDGEATEGAYAKALSKMNTLLAKIKGKKTVTSDDVEESEKIKNDIKKTAAVATVAVTIGAAIGIFRHVTKKASLKPAGDIIDSTSFEIKDATDTDIQQMCKIVSNHGQIIKDAVSANLDYATQIWKNMIAGIKGQKALADVTTALAVKESAEDETFDAEAYLESVENEIGDAKIAHFDADEYIGSLMTESEAEPDITPAEEEQPTEESADVVMSAADAYLESLEAEVFGDIHITKTTVVEESTDDIIGSFTDEINKILGE